MAKQNIRNDQRPSVDVEKRIEADWQDCTRCPLHGSRTQVVFTRGTLPADICFIGGAPTSIDDVSGVPLSGPTGNMLDTIIRELSLEADLIKSPFTWSAFTTVGCVPWNNVEQLTVRPPDRQETDACLPRLISLLTAAKPSGLVLLGSVADYYWNRYRLHFKQAGFDLPILSIAHPNEAIHNGGASSSNMVYSGIKISIKQFLFRNVLPARRSSFG